MTGVRGRDDLREEQKLGGSEFEPNLIEPDDCCRQRTSMVAELGEKNIERQLTVAT